MRGPRRAVLHLPLGTGVPGARGIAFALYFLLMVVADMSSAGSFDLSGYYKNYSVVFDPAEYEGGSGQAGRTLVGSVNSRLRLALACSPAPWLSFRAAYDFSPRIQDRSLFNDPLIVVSLDPAMYRAGDLEPRVYPSKGDPVASFGIFQNLDRAVIGVSIGAVDVHVGRQVIAWGSARAVNPTDVIAPFIFSELDTEDRVGVDALRVRFPLGAMGEVDGGYVTGEALAFAKSALFLRSKLHLAGTDVSLLFIGFRENLMVGLDLAGSAGGAGLYLEAAHVLTGAIGAERGGDGEDYFRVTAGCDYSLSTRAYGFVEYHFSQAGESEPARYLARLEESAYREGAVYLLGKNYLAPGLHYQLTPLLTLGAEALWNLGDLSLFLAPSLEYNLSEDVYISLGAFWGHGESPQLLGGDPALPLVEFRSEFGGYPDVYFSSFKFYF